MENVFLGMFSEVYSMPFDGINPKSVVIMDNASMRHVEEVVDTIQRFLPPYCPDLNPCEEVFAQVKHWIQSNDMVFQATQYPSVLIAMAYCEVTQQNCLSCIRDSGYTVASVPGLPRYVRVLICGGGDNAVKTGTAWAD